MPIIISRNTDAPPIITNTPSEEQINALFGQILRSWTERNPEKFRDMLENGVPGKEVPA